MILHRCNYRRAQKRFREREKMKKSTLESQVCEGTSSDRERELHDCDGHSFYGSWLRIVSGAGCGAKQKVGSLV